MRKMSAQIDAELLNIKNPINQQGHRAVERKPCCIVHKGKGYAIVAMTWRCKPCLGIRWFGERGGRGYPSSWGRWRRWFVLPNELACHILSCPEFLLNATTADKKEDLRTDVKKFLAKKMKYAELKERWYAVTSHPDSSTSR